MKQYLQLNQAKLKFMFKATSIIFGTCVLVFFIIAYFKEKYIPELSLFLSVIAGFSIGMSLLTGIIATLSGYYYYNLKRKKFQTFPFSELDKLGFKLIKCQEETNWALTEEVLSGRINGFQVVFDIDLKNEPNILRAKAITLRQLERNEMRRIKRDLKEINAEFDFFGITKKFHLKKHGLSSFTELEYELQRFTNILKQEHFEPENQEWS